MIGEEVYRDLIGTEYSKMDCLGLVREFYKRQYGVEVKTYYEAPPNDIHKAKELLHLHKGDLEKINVLMPGNILVLKVMGVPSHLAIYLGGGKLLHSTSKTGCVIEKLSKWSTLIEGNYRIRQNDTNTIRSNI